MKKIGTVAAIGAAFVLGFLAHAVERPVAHAQTAKGTSCALTRTPGKLASCTRRFKNTQCASSDARQTLNGSTPRRRIRP